jgi:hypothetical protein
MGEAAARKSRRPLGRPVTTPGCYGFQIDGIGFSRMVFITVDLQR